MPNLWQWTCRHVLGYLEPWNLPFGARKITLKRLKNVDAAALKMDAAASSNPRGACCSIHFRMLQHAQIHKTARPIDRPSTSKIHQIKTTIDFNVIPTEKVSYTSLVYKKNNKLEPQEQNFGD